MSTPGAELDSMSDARTTMRVASTWSTMPERRAAIATPLSRATRASMPVPMIGASARISGTAWRCMFEPMSARLASSFSRNGMRAAATDTSCLGDTSASVMSSDRDITNSPPLRHEIRSWVKRPSSSIVELAWATV